MHVNHVLAPAIGGSSPDAPLHIAHVGRFRSEGDFRWEQVSRHAVLHCIHAGSGTISEDGREHTVQAGDLFLFRQGCHYRYFDHPGAHWRYDYVTFTGGGTDSLPAILGLEDRRLHLDAGHPFWRGLAETVRAYSQASVSLPNACRWTWTLLATLDRDDEAGRADLGRQVIDYVRLLHTGYPSVDELAATFGVSRATLYRHVRQATGMSIKTWMDDRRFERAGELLSHTDAPVRTVAGLCGFADPLYFSRAFRRRHGLAPAAWREARRQPEAVERGAT